MKLLEFILNKINTDYIHGKIFFSQEKNLLGVNVVKTCHAARGNHLSDAKIKKYLDHLQVATSSKQFYRPNIRLMRQYTKTKTRNFITRFWKSLCVFGFYMQTETTLKTRKKHPLLSAI